MRKPRGKTSPSRQTVNYLNRFIWLMPDSPDEAPTLAEDHPLIRLMYTLKLALSGFRGWNRCPSNTTSAASPPQGPQGASDEGTASNKRQRHRGFGCVEANDEDDDSLVGLNVSDNRRRTLGGKLTFACRFTKNDPMRHLNCYKYMLKRIREVKQPSNAVALPARQEITFESFRGGPVVSVFNILFTNHPRPQSPYIDSQLLQDITLYQEFVVTRGPRIIADTLNSNGALFFR